MDGQTFFDALILGIVEGLTEFIPVSSTGHILLLGHFLGFESTGKTFEVLIQLGAILAILTVYSARLWKIAVALPSDQNARRFVFGILLAFLPAAVIGVMAHKYIKEVLFESPALICSTLLIDRGKLGKHGDQHEHRDQKCTAKHDGWIRRGTTHLFTCLFFTNQILA